MSTGAAKISTKYKFLVPALASPSLINNLSLATMSYWPLQINKAVAGKKVLNDPFHLYDEECVICLEC